MKIDQIPSFMEVVKNQSDTRQLDALIEYWQNTVPQDEYAILNGTRYKIKSKEEWLKQKDVLLPELLKLKASKTANETLN